MANKSESALLNEIRLEAAQKNIYLWRNNVGAVKTDTGSFIRFGLANDSSQINSVLKSSDLIGIKPFVITLNDVGKVVGQFICREVKKSDWVYRGDDRERAQLAWIHLINQLGGDADFVTKSGEL